jgi:hypothetical protein
VVANDIVRESRINKEVPAFDTPEELSPLNFNAMTLNRVDEYLNDLDRYYGDVFQRVSRQKENFINFQLERDPMAFALLRDRYHNEGVADIVRKVYEKNKILEFNHRLIQHYDPIYQYPDVSNRFTFRTHFFSPVKPFAGKTFDTFWFNMAIIWLLTLVLYLALYFEWLKKLITASQRYRKKNGTKNG